VTSRDTARLLAALALFASACTGARGEPSPSASNTSTEPVTVQVAYFQDSTIDEPYQHELPALQGFHLALSRAAEAGTMPVEVEVVALDTRGDPATALALAQQVADDPTFVAVVAAPFWSESDEVGKLLDGAGLLTLGLSELGERSDAWGGRLRLVPAQAHQIEGLVAYVQKRAKAGGACVAHDATPYGTSVSAELAEALGPLLSEGVLVADDGAEVAGVVDRVRDAGCSFVAWTGFGTGAAALRVGLTDEGLRSVRLVASDAVKTEGYLEAAGKAGEGTIVSCGCVDLTTSTELEAQVFIHDYQSEYGSAPGVFSAEGLDAGNLLIDLLGSGPPTRDAVRAAALSIASFEGLAQTYVFTGGELEGPTISLFADRGQRWAPFVPRGT
jgi:branched-chain amino acid transport system substrate-binding protein